MKISPHSGEGWAGLLAADYIDPRDLGPASPLQALAIVFLQELRDKGRSEQTVPRYAAYIADFVSFMERGGKTARVSDIDIRALKAYGSHLTRRQVRSGRYGGRGTISAATKNLHLIALRQLLKFGVLIDLPVPGPEKVELAKAVPPSPDARHLAEERVKRLLDACETATDKGIRARALLEFLLATGCRVSEAVGLDRRQLELDRLAPTPKDGIRVVDEVTVFGKGSRYRRVYLSKKAREWVQRYLAVRKDKDKALFVTQKKSADGSYRMSVWTAEQIVRDAAKRAGLAEDVSPHWLRHAAITFWAKGDLSSAQRLAGHRQIATTQRYLGSSDAELKAFYKRHVEGASG
ncbi:MAG TPA: tyrosine-type recombinase/integrase [Candidatus Limnocylindria bacterium]|nr:tyrosine-type recombinase/integrase [Candidatus Limnocylindria bacterium]